VTPELVRRGLRSSFPQNPENFDGCDLGQVQDSRVLLTPPMVFDATTRRRVEHVLPSMSFMDPLFVTWFKKQPITEVLFGS
jgi:hypothetical protein